MQDQPSSSGTDEALEWFMAVVRRELPGAGGVTVKFIADVMRRIAEKQYRRGYRAGVEDQRRMDEGDNAA